MLTANPVWGTPPPDIDLQQSLTHRVVAVHVVLFVMSILAVCLRLICRRLVRTPLWWDDYFILLAQLGNLIWGFVTVPWMVQKGLGKHIWVLGPMSLVVTGLGTYIQEICYIFIQACVKFSIMALLWRLFNPAGIGPKIYVIGTLVIIWAVIFEFVTIFQCSPVQGAWARLTPEPSIQANCALASKKVNSSMYIPNTIFDAVLFIMPIPFIWHLQISLPQKIALVSVFTVGLFVTGVSITRLYYLSTLTWDGEDLTWGLTIGVIWSDIELNTAIICACMPLLRPLVNLVVFGNADPLHFRGRSSKPTLFPWYRSKHRRGSILQEGGDREDFFRQSCRADGDNHTRTKIERLSNVPELELGNVEHDKGIVVRTDIQVGNEGHHDRL